MAQQLFHKDVREVTCCTLRRKNFQEVTAEKNGEVLLCFAAGYCFRNIQDMVLELEKGKLPCHLVEVACLDQWMFKRQRPSLDQGWACRQGAAVADGRHQR